MLTKTFSRSIQLLLGVVLSILSVVPAHADSLKQTQNQLGRICAMVTDKEAVVKLQDGSVFHTQLSNSDGKDGDAVLTVNETQVILANPKWLGILIEKYGFTLPGQDIESWKKTSC